MAWKKPWISNNRIWIQQAFPPLSCWAIHGCLNRCLCKPSSWPTQLLWTNSLASDPQKVRFLVAGNGETKKLFLQVIPSTWHGEKNMVRITNGTLQKWGGIHRILPINSHLKNSELEDHFLEQLHPKCEVFSAVCGKLWLLPAHPVSF